MADTKKTKSFDSDMLGAPVLSGTTGSLAAVLDAALVTGFGLQTASSVVVTGGIATATYATAHSFRAGTVALVAGATPAGLNGEKRILTVVSDKIVTFDAAGIADGTATGTITSKVAPAGWTKAFSGTNVAAYKPASPEATGCMLRIDDTGTATARAVGYESMSGINTGIGAFPTSVMVSGGDYWWKSDAANATPRAWRLFADERLVYLWVAAGVSTQTQGALAVFGDINSAKSGDAWACAINGFGSAANTSSEQRGCAGYGNAAAAATYEFVIARSHLGLGGAQLAKKLAAHNLGVGYSATAPYNPNALSFPNGPDNSLRLAPVEVVSGGSIRGVMPGLYHSPQLLGGIFSTGDRVEGTGAYAGRTFCALVVGPGYGGTPGVVFIDITDWR